MTLATAVAYHQKQTLATPGEAAIVIRAPNDGWRIRKGVAFVSIKPYAGAISEGTTTAEQIDKDTPIDTHYGAIAANVIEQSLGI